MDKRTYSRFGKDSDVNVYYCKGIGLVCSHCSIELEETNRQNRIYRALDATDMIQHLQAHVQYKHLVPDELFERLEEDLFDITWI